MIATAKDTELSKISEKVRFKPPQTAFEIGVKKFGFFLLQVTIFIVSVIFLLNIYFKKPLIESFLFSTALAVGLTPQLLPVIISINLSRGAKKMAEMKVVVKRLPAIENFGQMNLLCTDKTGTLTLGKTRLESAVDSWGKISEKVAQYAFLNSHFQQGYVNPIDKAILEGKSYSTAGFEKIDEYPYDFERKRLTVVLKNEGRKLLITKGTCAQVLAVCNRIECSDGSVTPFNDHQKEIQKYFEEQSEKGFRALAVAYGDNEEEKDLIFLGLLNFVDPIKPTAVDAIDRLEKKGIKLKVITGDNQLVSKYVAKSVGLPLDSFLTGEELQKISDEELVEVVKKKSVFAEIEPNQKERIIFALKKAGNVIGYMGDGVNDVSALHSADVSIAVDSGADAAKEVADIVLLEKDLHVLNLGVEEGRRTFVNTMKYVYMATSANFGNMFSMAGASLFLPFFPLLPQQVLLTNFLSDFPQTALATDRVDADVVTRPVKWDIPYIRRFMMVFGTLNSVADYLTFAVLLLWLKAGETLFQSGWFVENVVTAALIVFVIRTKKKFWKSKPGVLLCLMILSIAILVPFIPYTSFGALFGFAPIPLIFYPYLAGITAIYFATAEIAKRYFFKKFHSKSSQGGP